jgi:FKBP-type peptidyl-prolyl cis-trans isomerase 2
VPNLIWEGSYDYEFTQVAPEPQWRILHNMAKRPTIVCIITGNKLVNPNITYVNGTEVILDFRYPVAGKAYLG